MKRDYAAAAVALSLLTSLGLLPERLLQRVVPLQGVAVGGKWRTLAQIRALPVGA